MNNNVLIQWIFFFDLVYEVCSCRHRFGCGNAMPGCYPALVYFPIGDRSNSFCSSVIVRQHLLLTSDHCTKEFKNREVHVVGGRMNPTQPYFYERQAMVHDYVTHPKFNSHLCNAIAYCPHDIAVVKVNRRLYEDAYINNPSLEVFIIVRNTSVSASKPEQGAAVFAARFGKVHDIKRFRSTDGVLQVGSKCSNHPERRGTDYVCISGEDYVGDSGSGLFLRTKGGYTLIGIDTIGRSSSASFTSVAPYCSWIEETAKTKRNKEFRYH